MNYFQSGRYSTVSGIQLRDQPKRYTTVNIDGVKVLDPSTPSNDYYFNNLMSGSFDRIEVLKGAKALYFLGSEKIIILLFFYHNDDQLFTINFNFRNVLIAIFTLQ